MSTSDKADRLAAKLRENLRRRKAQARDVAQADHRPHDDAISGDPAPGDPPESPG